MKKLRTQLICIVLVLFSITSCEKNNADDSTPDSLNNTKSAQLITAGNEFGIDLFKKINEAEDNEKNLMISPVSVACALAMTYNGADGETKTAMETTLKLNGLTVDEINTTYQNLFDALLRLDEKVLLTIANSIWYRDDFSVEQDFIDVNKKYYDAEVRSLDFSNPASLDIINGWIEDKTNDKIEDMIKEISPNAVMFLINAIYFKGTWQYEFDEENTTDKTFTLNDGTTKQVATMVQKQNFNY